VNLQTKLWLGMGAAYLALVVGAGAYSYSRTQDAVIEEMRDNARAIQGLLMATRRVYHLQFMDSGIPLDDRTLGFLPAHALSRISRELPNWNSSGLSFNNVSDRARNPYNRADADELKAIAYFREHPGATELLTHITVPTGERFYHFTAPIRVEPYCLTCHGAREHAPPTVRDRYPEGYGYLVGELRGVVSIKLPERYAQARVMALWQDAIWLNLAAFGAAFLVGVNTRRGPG